MSDLTFGQATSTDNLLRDLRAAVDSDEREYEGQDVYEYLSEMPLEIVWEKGEPFCVVLGTGGPHVDITGGGRWDHGRYVLNVYWGGAETHLRSDAIDWAGGYFREYVSDLD